MFRKFWEALKRIFAPQKPSKPEPRPSIPISDPSGQGPDLGSIPPVFTPPTAGGRVLDTVNDGNPRTPDHTYLYDNLVIDPDKVAWARREAKKIFDNFPRYKKVTDAIGVPEWFIGLYHYRESSLSFSGVLHNGDKIIGKGTKTYRVPKGRGPFNTWEESAIDALSMNGKNYNNRTDWSLKAVLPLMERWNGLGYRKKIGDRGVIEYSPFIVAGSEWHDETSKYVSDGKYDPNAPEKQLGVFTILKMLEKEFGVVLK